MHRIIRRFVAPLLILFVVISCGQGSRSVGTGPDDEPTIEVTKAPQRLSELVFELDAYDLTIAEKAEIKKARNLYRYDCMKTFGFELDVPPSEPAQFPRNAHYLARLDLYDVSQYGYKMPPELEDRIAAANMRSQPLVVPNHMLDVFEGRVETSAGKPVPDEGCLGKVQRMLNKDAPEVELPGGEEGQQAPGSDIAKFKGQIFDQAISDSRFQAMLDSWSSCMRQSGFDYDRPADAEQDPRWNTPGGAADPEDRAVTRLEIRTASADKLCRKEVNYTGLLYGLMLAYEKRVIDEHGEVLRSIEKRSEARLRNAVAMLDER